MNDLSREGAHAGWTLGSGVCAFRRTDGTPPPRLELYDLADGRRRTLFLSDVPIVDNPSYITAEEPLAEGLVSEAVAAWQHARVDYRNTDPPAPLLVISTSVTALDRSSGSQLWSYELGAAPRRVHADDERIYVLDADGTVHCLLSATGHVIGKVGLGLRNANALLWDGECFFVTGDSQVVALDRDGGVLWRTKVTTNGAWGLGGLAVGTRISPPDFSRD